LAARKIISQTRRTCQEENTHFAIKKFIPKIQKPIAITAKSAILVLERGIKK